MGKRGPKPKAPGDTIHVPGWLLATVEAMKADEDLGREVVAIVSAKKKIAPPLDSDKLSKVV